MTNRFARCTEIMPYTLRVATSFLPREPFKESRTRGAMIDGKFRVYTVSGHCSRSGVKFNRLLRFRRRVLS
ncbi:hypothetical protein [Marinobacter sp. OP 3.4]|uniref:hypothetical protein n=1 Tax=Marinobacter sp. OP 3.4 TaxID=3076501 RepID=UPI002E1D8600